MTSPTVQSVRTALAKAADAATAVPAATLAAATRAADALAAERPQSTDTGQGK